MTEQTVISPTEAPEANVPGYEDYWGTDETIRHNLPDGKQYFEIKVMNEGERAKFQRLTNQDLIVNRDNSARVKMDPARERHSLITTSVVGWNLYKGGEVVGFSPQILEKWLSAAPPKIVDDLEFAIRKANPWMQADMEPDQIREEIGRLEELLQQTIDRQAGEAASANK
jgi:hypothetical protein